MITVVMIPILVIAGVGQRRATARAAAAACKD